MAPPRKPTDAELAVLRVLWERGASTVREVHDQMAQSRTVAYTTTLKTLQVMTAKGLTAREDSRGQHLYRPVQNEDVTQRRLVKHLLQQAFGGSMSKLVLQALATQPASADELREIRQLLDQSGKGDKKRVKS